MTNREILLPLDALRAPQRVLHAGKLNCIYESGSIRRISYGTHELVRMIYPALRDSNWNTIEPIISKEKIDAAATFFHIKYTATYNSGPISYQASFEIFGKEDNSIRFAMNGKAITAFKRNRIGLCVHHPANNHAGKEVTIIHSDGGIEHTSFPAVISPHQPLKDVREMSWKIDNTLESTLRFSGDVFETEDQRNWSDSSFKTYSTPLELPFPVILESGEKMSQEVIFECKGDLMIAVGEKREEAIRFPHTGFNRVSRELQLSEKNKELALRVPFEYYRVMIDTGGEDWQNELDRAIEDARDLAKLLELVVVFDTSLPTIINDFLFFIDGVKQIGKILPLEKSSYLTTSSLFEKLYDPVKKSSPQTEIGYGCSGNFADLNRNRPTELPFDFLSFTIYPQVHLSDTRSIWENLDNQLDCLRTAESFSDGKPIDIQLLFSKASDTRQHSYFMALWTLMSIQNLAEAGLLILTDLTGENGLLPDRSEPTPLYSQLSDLYGFDPTHIIRRYNGNTLLMDQFCVENSTGERLSIRFAEAGF